MIMFSGLKSMTSINPEPENASANSRYCRVEQLGDFTCRAYRV